MLLKWKCSRYIISFSTFHGKLISRENKTREYTIIWWNNSRSTRTISARKVCCASVNRYAVVYECACRAPHAMIKKLLIRLYRKCASITSKKKSKIANKKGICSQMTTFTVNHGSWCICIINLLYMSKHNSNLVNIILLRKKTQNRS